MVDKSSMFGFDGPMKSTQTWAPLLVSLPNWELEQGSSTNQLTAIDSFTTTTHPLPGTPWAGLQNLVSRPAGTPKPEEMWGRGGLVRGLPKAVFEQPSQGAWYGQQGSIPSGETVRPRRRQYGGNGRGGESHSGNGAADLAG